MLSGRELIALLRRAGFEVVRQKGSHMSLAKGQWRTVVPLHDEFARSTLTGILVQCGITRADLEELLHG